MSLSDEILARPGTIAPIRSVLSGLVSELSARSAFLVDEAGTPFGAFGNAEFPLPYPLSSLTGRTDGDPLLEALVGEGGEAHSPTLVVQRVSARALLVVEMEEALSDSARRATLERVQATAKELLPLIAGPTGPAGSLDSSTDPA